MDEHLNDLWQSMGGEDVGSFEDFKEFYSDVDKRRDLWESMGGEKVGSFEEFEEFYGFGNTPDIQVPKSDTTVAQNVPVDTTQNENVQDTTEQVDIELIPEGEITEKPDYLSDEIDQLKSTLDAEGTTKYGAAVSLIELGDKSPIVIETLKDAVQSYDVSESIRQESIKKLEELGEEVPDIPEYTDEENKINIGGEKIENITVTEKKTINTHWDKFSREPAGDIEVSKEVPLIKYKEDVIAHEKKLKGEDINGVLKNYTEKKDEKVKKRVNLPSAIYDEIPPELADTETESEDNIAATSEYRRIQGEVLLEGNALKTYKNKIKLAAKERYGENWENDIKEQLTTLSKLAKDLQDYNSGNTQGVSENIIKSKVNQFKKLNENLDKYRNDPVIKEYFDTEKKLYENSKMFFAFFPEENEFKKKIAEEQQKTDEWGKEQDIINTTSFHDPMIPFTPNEALNFTKIFAAHVGRWFVGDFVKGIKSTAMLLAGEDKRYEIAADLYQNELMTEYMNAKIPSDLHGQFLESAAELEEGNEYGLKAGDKLIFDGEGKFVRVRDAAGYEKHLSSEQYSEIAKKAEEGKHRLKLDNSYSGGRLLSASFDSAADMALSMAIGFGWGKAGTSLFGNLASKSVGELATLRGASEIIGSKILTPEIGFFTGTGFTVFGNYLQTEIDKGGQLNLDGAIGKAMLRTGVNAALETFASPMEIRLLKGKTLPGKVEDFILQKTRLGNKLRELATKNPNLYAMLNGAYGFAAPLVGEDLEEGEQGLADMYFDKVFDGTKMTMPDMHTIVNTTAQVVTQSAIFGYMSGNASYKAAQNKIASAFMYMNLQDIDAYEKKLENKVILGDLTDSEVYNHKLIIREAKKVLDENKNIPEHAKEKIAGHLVYIASQKERLFNLNITEEERAKIEQNITAATNEVNSVLAENGGTLIQEPLSPRGKVKVDFDNTLYDNTSKELTYFGANIRRRIANGEDIQVLSAREDTPENRKFISDMLGISEDKIHLGLSPVGKASFLQKGDIFYDDNPENIKAARAKGVEAIQTIKS